MLPCRNKIRSDRSFMSVPVLTRYSTATSGQDSIYDDVRSVHQPLSGSQEVMFKQAEPRQQPSGPKMRTVGTPNFYTIIYIRLQSATVVDVTVWLLCAMVLTAPWTSLTQRVTRSAA